MTKTKILFIINPVSGGGKQKKIVPPLIDKYLDKTIFLPEIIYTKAPQHATEISRQAIGKYDYVVAVGGDGSVNEVGKGLVNSSVKMGILPFGSGNGLARHLRIPLNTTKAIKLLNTKAKKCIDTFEINGEFAINVAGVGFDAHIAHKFATYGTRGFLSYATLTLSEFKAYKAQSYELKINGKLYNRAAFLISFANSSQFGNNALIAPTAIIDDGLLNIAILKAFPAWKALQIGGLLFSGGLNRSDYYEELVCTEFSLTTTKSIVAHIDGEPVKFPKEIHVSIQAQSLTVVTLIE